MKQFLARIIEMPRITQMTLLAATFTSACGRSPAMTFRSYDELKEQAGSLGCVQGTYESGKFVKRDEDQGSRREFSCTKLLGPCSCRMELHVIAVMDGVVRVEVALKECPSDYLGESGRLDASKVVSKLDPFVAGKEWFKQIESDLYAHSLSDGRVRVKPSLLGSTRPPFEALPFERISEHRFADVLVTSISSADALERTEPEQRKQAERQHTVLFGLGTNTTIVRMAGSAESGETPSSHLFPLDSPHAACLDGTLRPWQVYAFDESVPPHIAPVPVLRLAGEGPRSMAALWAEISELVSQWKVVNKESNDPERTERLQKLQLAHDELVEIYEGALDREQSKLSYEMMRAGDKALLQIEERLDLLAESGISRGVDLRESGLEQLFILEEDIRSLAHAHPLHRRWRYFYATQPLITWSGSR
jgi:hypothetical protein